MSPMNGRHESSHSQPPPGRPPEVLIPPSTWGFISGCLKSSGHTAGNELTPSGTDCDQREKRGFGDTLLSPCPLSTALKSGVTEQMPKDVLCGRGTHCSSS